MGKRFDGNQENQGDQGDQGFVVNQDARNSLVTRDPMETGVTRD